MKTELDLIKLAQTAKLDEVANNAMKELRANYDETYMFCNECDGAVVKMKNCCMNQPFREANLDDFEIIETDQSILNELKF